MLQTIQVEIDASGHLLLMEPISFKPVGRALLTLLDTTDESISFQILPNDERGSMLRVLKLLASPRFAHRPPANINEVAKHITAMRNEWDTE